MYLGAPFGRLSFPDKDGPLVASFVLGSFVRGMDVSLRVVLTFPEKPAAESEPLVVTGRTGSADFLYGRYLSGGNLKFV
jgi:hypothetical protein